MPPCDRIGRRSVRTPVDAESSAPIVRGLKASDLMENAERTDYPALPSEYSAPIRWHCTEIE